MRATPWPAACSRSRTPPWRRTISPRSRAPTRAAQPAPLTGGRGGGVGGGGQAGAGAVGRGGGGGGLGAWSAGPEAGAGRGGAPLVGAEGAIAVAGRGAPAESLTVRVPDWASRAVVDITMPR